MLTQTLQGALQAEIRAATGKTNQDFNGDLHDLCTIYGVPMAPISGRIIPVAQIFDSSINSSASALNYLLKNATTVVGPRGLFAAGEQGAWYDPSDVTTLFQDSAGTTPVTAVEQPVGLVLDKSKGLVLGSEAVAYPLTAGSINSSYSIVGDTVVRNGSTGTVVLNTASGTPIVQNQTYLVQFTASNVTGDAVAIRVGNGTAYGPFAGNGTFTVRAVSGTVPTSAITFLPNGGGAATAIYSNITVKLLPGNHAYQTTSASRPTLRARYNLLLNSESSYNNGLFWELSSSTFSASGVTDPNGTTNAATFVIAAGGAISGYATLPVAAYAGSIWLKGTGSVALNLMTNGYVSRASTSVTLTGTWTRYTVLGSTQAGDTIAGVRITSAAGATVDVYGRQLTQTAVFPSNTYQRIAAATDYATGAAFPPYLFFDGVDDSLLTNSVDFSAGATNPPLSSELVTNGNFSSATGWTLPAGCTISGGVLNVSTVSTGLVETTIAPNPGARWFLCTWQLVTRSAGDVILRLYSGPSNVTVSGFSFQSSPGIFTAYILTSADPNKAVIQIGGGGLTGTIDNISVRELLDSSLAPDKMTVWAGVTKSSDAAAGMLAELSSEVSVNAGSFYAAVPESALIRYSIISRGNATLNANQRADTTSNTYLAPITNVLTGTFNISGDSNILRLNGAQVSQATGDQGTGNYGNYPLYIGRRNNATLPLNGNIYSLIIRGAQSTAAQISSTESWVAAKTPLGSL